MFSVLFVLLYLFSFAHTLPWVFSMLLFVAAPPSQGLVVLFLQVTVIFILGEGVVVMVMDPLLFQGQSLDLQLCTLGLLHGLELMGCRHGAGEGGRLGQVTERSAEQLLAEHLAVSEGVSQDRGA